ncbi:MAG: hypothetical protein AAF405_00475 [Pseudomonadota bacterium]
MATELRDATGLSDRFYVVLTLHRTGSTFFCNALNGHPDIICAGEIFNSEGARKNNIDLERPIASLDRWLETHPNVPFLGFKLMLDQSPDVLEEVARRRFRIIFLTRPNELARHSSQLIARHTGRRFKASLLARGSAYILKNVSGSYSNPMAQQFFDRANKFAGGTTTKVAFDKKRFLLMQQRQEALMSEAEAVLAKYSLEPLRVTYPDVTKPEIMSAALKFLGATDRQLVAMTTKMNPPDIMERFSNPEDVRQFLEEIHHPEWETE